jgi:GNAT superfamily N-acetyltransferase
MKLTSKKLQFRRTTPADIPTILHFMETAKKELAAQGVDQWQDGYPNETSLFEDIRRGESYVVITTDGHLVASAMISFSCEVNYNKIEEGKWLTSGKPCYGVIHRIVIAPEAKRKGVASFIIEQLHKMAVQEQAGSLRIDTHRDNMPM